MAPKRSHPDDFSARTTTLKIRRTYEPPTISVIQSKSLQEVRMPLTPLPVDARGEIDNLTSYYSTDTLKTNVKINDQGMQLEEENRKIFPSFSSDFTIEEGGQLPEVKEESIPLIEEQGAEPENWDRKNFTSFSSNVTIEEDAQLPEVKEESKPLIEDQGIEREEWGDKIFPSFSSGITIDENVQLPEVKEECSCECKQEDLTSRATVDSETLADQYYSSAEAQIVSVEECEHRKVFTPIDDIRHDERDTPIPTEYFELDEDTSTSDGAASDGNSFVISWVPIEDIAGSPSTVEYGIDGNVPRSRATDRTLEIDCPQGEAAVEDGPKNECTLLKITSNHVEMKCASEFIAEDGVACQELEEINPCMQDDYFEIEKMPKPQVFNCSSVTAANEATMKFVELDSEATTDHFGMEKGTKPTGQLDPVSRVLKKTHNNVGTFMIKQPRIIVKRWHIYDETPNKCEELDSRTTEDTLKIERESKNVKKRRSKKPERLVPRLEKPRLRSLSNYFDIEKLTNPTVLLENPPTANEVTKKFEELDSHTPEDPSKIEKVSKKGKKRRSKKESKKPERLNYVPQPLKKRLQCQNFDMEKQTNTVLNQNPPVAIEAAKKFEEVDFHAPEDHSGMEKGSEPPDQLVFLQQPLEEVHKNDEIRSIKSTRSIIKRLRVHDETLEKLNELCSKTEGKKERSRKKKSKRANQLEKDMLEVDGTADVHPNVSNSSCDDKVVETDAQMPDHHLGSDKDSRPAVQLGVSSQPSGELLTSVGTPLNCTTGTVVSTDDQPLRGNDEEEEGEFSDQDSSSSSVELLPFGDESTAADPADLEFSDHDLCSSSVELLPFWNEGEPDDSGAVDEPDSTTDSPNLDLRYERGCIKPIDNIDGSEAKPGDHSERVDEDKEAETSDHDSSLDNELEGADIPNTAAENDHAYARIPGRQDLSCPDEVPVSKLFDHPFDSSYWTEEQRNKILFQPAPWSSRNIAEKERLLMRKYVDVFPWICEENQFLYCWPCILFAPRQNHKVWQVFGCFLDYLGPNPLKVGLTRILFQHENAQVHNNALTVMHEKWKEQGRELKGLECAFKKSEESDAAGTVAAADGDSLGRIDEEETSELCDHDSSFKSELEAANHPNTEAENDHVHAQIAGRVEPSCPDEVPVSQLFDHPFTSSHWTEEQRNKILFQIIPWSSKNITESERLQMGKYIDLFPWICEENQFLYCWPCILFAPRQNGKVWQVLGCFLDYLGPNPLKVGLERILLKHDNAQVHNNALTVMYEKWKEQGRELTEFECASETLEESDTAGTVVAADGNPPGRINEEEKADLCGHNSSFENELRAADLPNTEAENDHVLAQITGRVEPSCPDEVRVSQLFDHPFASSHWTKDQRNKILFQPAPWASRNITESERLQMKKYIDLFPWICEENQFLYCWPCILFAPQQTDAVWHVASFLDYLGPNPLKVGLERILLKHDNAKAHNNAQTVMLEKWEEQGRELIEFECASETSEESDTDGTVAAADGDSPGRIDEEERSELCDRDSSFKSELEAADHPNTEEENDHVHAQIAGCVEPSCPDEVPVSQLFDHPFTSSHAEHVPTTVFSPRTGLGPCTVGVYGNRDPPENKEGKMPKSRSPSQPAAQISGTIDCQEPSCSVPVLVSQLLAHPLTSSYWTDEQREEIISQRAPWSNRNLTKSEKMQLKKYVEKAPWLCEDNHVLYCWQCILFAPRQNHTVWHVANYLNYLDSNPRNVKLKRILNQHQNSNEHDDAVNVFVKELMAREKCMLLWKSLVKTVCGRKNNIDFASNPEFASEATKIIKTFYKKRKLDQGCVSRLCKRISTFANDQLICPMILDVQSAVYVALHFEDLSAGSSLSGEYWLAVIARHAEWNGSIQERVVDFVRISPNYARRSATTVVKFIEQVLREHQLTYNVVAFSHSSSVVVPSEIPEFHKQLTKICPRAMCFYYPFYDLRKALFHSLMRSSDSRAFFVEVQELYEFIVKSSTENPDHDYEMNHPVTSSGCDDVCSTPTDSVGSSVGCIPGYISNCYSSLMAKFQHIIKTEPVKNETPIVREAMKFSGFLQSAENRLMIIVVAEIFSVVSNLGSAVDRLDWVDAKKGLDEAVSALNSMLSLDIVGMYKMAKDPLLSQVVHPSGTKYTSGKILSEMSNVRNLITESIAFLTNSLSNVYQFRYTSPVLLTFPVRFTRYPILSKDFIRRANLNQKDVDQLKFLISARSRLRDLDVDLDVCNHSTLLLLLADDDTSADAEDIPLRDKYVGLNKYLLYVHTIAFTKTLKTQLLDSLSRFIRSALFSNPIACDNVKSLLYGFFWQQETILIEKMLADPDFYSNAMIACGLKMEIDHTGSRLVENY